MLAIVRFAWRMANVVPHLRWLTVSASHGPAYSLLAVCYDVGDANQWDVDVILC